MSLSEKTVERLSEYRRHLSDLQARGVEYVFSGALAQQTDVTPAQVRRDMMNLGLTGNTARGYSVDLLLSHLRTLLDQPTSTKVVLVGVGNLGMALLAHFKTRPGHANIVVGFDQDPEKAGRVVHGCRIFNTKHLEEEISARAIKVAILCIPAADANRMAARLVNAGITGILNFAPVRLRVPEPVYVHNMDLTGVIEKVGYYAGRGTRALGELENMVAR
ncbi:MAG TPA: redox-sensing transcriptional repressor Rex [Myxococcota bacterium]|nr:redox-sensing transcriptional repressor Rex [Myxococcota bacterium]HOD08874.1 redox-sensing transcriptional repressor Rex [Myxococcota bacterium]HPB49685.1 redox-sensing transcriptional repressor Rex [Myxococcota bacterium]HQP94699.1 redox-sensing transcriptional repressor Rex [Myxococcota bacterium]